MPISTKFLPVPCGQTFDSPLPLSRFSGAERHKGNTETVPIRWSFPAFSFGFCMEILAVRCLVFPAVKVYHGSKKVWRQKQMKSAVIYARYSSERQSEQSIEGQLRVCNDFAARNGLRIVGTYIDRAMTGTNDHRAEFQRMLSDSDTPQEWEIVLVYALDRFGRNSIEIAINKQRLQKNGKILISATQRTSQNIDGSQNLDGIILENVMIGIAEYYSAELSQKIRRGQNESREKGNFVGGGIAYGYKVVDKKVVVNEDEAEAVRTIFHQYVSGRVAREIIDTLHERGLSHRGKPFLPNAIYQILRNTRYIGFYTHNGKKYTNTFPPIIATELFNTVQAMLAKNKLGSHSRDTQFLLKGKLYCGICGKKMNGESGTSFTGKANYYYKCATKKKKSSACPKETVKKEEIEKLVVQTTIDILRFPETVEKIADAVVSIHQRCWQDKSILHLLKEDRDKKQKALKNLLSAVEEGLLTPTTKNRMTELEEEIDILNGKILAEESKEANMITKEQVVAFLTDLPEREPQLVIDTLIRKVVLFDDRIEIHYNFIEKPEPDEPDGTYPEDRRVIPFSFQSSLQSRVPPP